MSNYEVLSPCGEYRSIYKQKHADNVSAYFDSMVETSKVDVDANRETVKKYNASMKLLNESNKKLRGLKGLRGFIIAIFSISFAAAIILLVMGFMQNPILGLFIGIGFGLIAFGIGLILILTMIVNKKIKTASQISNKHKAESDALLSEAYIQMRALNQLFTVDIATALVQKTFPIMKFDTFLEQKRVSLLGEKYGLATELGKDRSILCLKSGDLADSPFMIAKILTHQMGTKTYTGSITITYRVYNGKNTTTRTQTLTASVTKPCPYYYSSTKVIFGNEGAPNLQFSRSPSKANGMTDDKIDKMIAKDQKKLQKVATKGVGNKNFTEMANSDFEVLFKALDRNNEVEFRLLFTPLAQIEMVKFIKDDEVGYGDDVFFDKINMLNILTPKHLDDFDLTGDPSHITSYDIDDISKRFCDYNNEYFRQIYYSVAPLLCIPLYQQHKPLEYIYKGVYDGYLANWQHEAVANALPERELRAPNCTTPCIMKTKFVQKDNDSDIIKVTAYGYNGVERTTVVQVWGNDGRSHAVPVRWVEYFPVSQDNQVVVKVDSKHKYANEQLYTVRERILSYMNRSKISSTGASFSPFLFAFISKGNPRDISKVNLDEVILPGDKK